MKRNVISIICIVLCGVILFSVGVYVGKSNSENSGITFITDREKDKWREPVEKLITELNDTEAPEGFFLKAYAYGLFDVNLDGVPELIRVLPGGSAGNLTYEGYDIYTGERIASFGGGNFSNDLNGDWCTYYKRDTEEFKNVGICITRGGADARFKRISCIEYNEERSLYREETILYCNYEMENDIVDDELVEKDVSVKFRLDGKEISFHEYDEQYDYFLKNYVRIDETTMYFVRVADVEKEKTNEFPKKMTEVLFGSSQRFLAVKKGA